MKLLVELLAKKAIELDPDYFENEEEALKELTEAFEDDEDGKMSALIGVLKDWAEQKTGGTVEIIPLD